MTNQQRYLGLGVALAVIAGAIWYVSALRPSQGLLGMGNNVAPRQTKEEKAAQYPLAKELSGIAGYVNTEKITLQELIGKKVVLVDFWTYSCINCQRTTPYLNAWYEKYKDQGLEIIGVQTPEFAFEKEFENVRRAVDQFAIKYPVVLDNQYATWGAYGNRYWPRKYLIDIDGYVVYDHIGEGGYGETERKIQELLAERKEVLGEQGGVDRGIFTPQNGSPDFSQPLSPETYFGAWRNELLGNGTPGKQGGQTFGPVENPVANALYLQGDWDIAYEYAENTGAGAKITFRYRAKNVYFVASANSPVTITVLRDGKPVGGAAGVDVANGSAAIQESRLYHLISEEAYGEHVLELIIEKPGLQAYTFTFG